MCGQNSFVVCLFCPLLASYGLGVSDSESCTVVHTVLQRLRNHRVLEGRHQEIGMNPSGTFVYTICRFSTDKPYISMKAFTILQNALSEMLTHTVTI